MAITLTRDQAIRANPLLPVSFAPMNEPAPVAIEDSPNGRALAGVAFPACAVAGVTLAKAGALDAGQAFGGFPVFGGDGGSHVLWLLNEKRLRFL
ncbi:hypothetical protein BFN67_01700 [Pseudaminobacter manganicus]|uniref:Uncharacterized protein n=1 Tax=Manganibacter manganicus TaxID=1873176 RepID=A0A1V8RWK4_9HYPH|nr:hypothetical protein BFN67_01700 [Pseudaminobacter manganicus]